MSHPAFTRLLPWLVVTAASAAACYDPTHLDAVANLGPEAPGVKEGPEHRPGQPCTTCHGGSGPAELELSIGGTIYSTRGQSAPMPGAVVTIIDGTGETRALRSNAAGNFYVARKDWDPAFPLEVVVEGDGIKREMVTIIGREGSCAACHRDGGDRTSMPGIYLRER